MQEIQTNSTILSKQIKIVTQLNAKQVDGSISDRNTIKAHGLQRNMRFYDSFSPDLVDIVYFQAIADGICAFDGKVELHTLFDENEEQRLHLLLLTGLYSLCTFGLNCCLVN